MTLRTDNKLLKKTNSAFTDGESARRNIAIGACVAFLVMIQFAAGFDAARKNSQTYDEAVHLAAGYSYYKTGDFKMNGSDHPPLAKLLAAAPLVIFHRPDFIPASHPWRADLAGNQFRVGDYFLYKNKIPAERLLLSGRVAMLVLSALFSVGFFLVARRLYDDIVAFAVLALWVFTPPVIANSFLITTDFTATVFYFLTFYFFYKSLNGGASKNHMFFAITAGAMAGLALGSKFSNILILPAIAIISIIILLGGGSRSCAISNLAVKILLFIVGAAILLWLCYFLGNLSPYFDGLEKILSSAAGEKPRPSYLLGQRSIGGWRYYFIASLFLKTPIAIIAAVIIFIAIALKNPEMKSRLKRDCIFFGIPALVFLTAASFSKIQIGHRHILPVYPLLILWAGGGVGAIFRRKTIIKTIAASIIVGSVAIEFYHSHPWHISYMTSMVGGQSHGEKYLLDSNFDWGQGLKDLSLFLKSQGVTDIYFSYFGSADPNYYGIRYYPIGFISTVERRGNDNFDITRQPRKYLAISATNLYGVYYADTNVFSFFKKSTPVLRAGKSIFVYDLEKITGAAQALSEVIEKYLQDTAEAKKLKSLSTDDKR